jgi:hypothetical protein
MALRSSLKSFGAPRVIAQFYKRSVTAGYARGAGESGKIEPMAPTSATGTTRPSKIALLLGAGFSYDLGMPLASELTGVLVGPFNERNVRQLVSAMLRGRPYGADRPPNAGALLECFEVLLGLKSANGQNYEAMLGQLELLAARYNISQSDRDSAHYVLATLYELIHDILSLYQAASYELCYPPNLQWYSTLGNVLSSEETWVFSLNHDLLLECLAIDLKIPISYGDVETQEFPISNLEMHERVRFSCIERSHYNIDSPGFIRARPGINLVKLHGGLSEHDYDDKKTICNLNLNRLSSKALLAEYDRVARMAYYQNGVTAAAAKDRFITNMNGECDVLGKAMLAGGRKYSETAKVKEGEEKLALLDRVLGEVDQLTVIGYGFGDKHVNFRISNAMARRDTLSVWIVDPHRHSTPECLELFDYDSRIRRAISPAPLWMDYCKSNRWDVAQMDALKENAARRKVVRERVETALRAGRRPLARPIQKPAASPQDK